MTVHLNRILQSYLNSNAVVILSEKYSGKIVHYSCIFFPKLTPAAGLFIMSFFGANQKDAYFANQTLPDKTRNSFIRS